VTTGAGDRYSQTGNACTPDGEEPASEEEAVANGEAQTNEAQESKVEKATGKAEATPDKKGGWVDWEIGLNSRYLIADVSGEDGFFGSPAELLPFAFRIFEAILKDGKNEDKKAAHGALKFLTENYQSFPAPQPAAPVAKRDVIIPESLKEVAQAKSDPAPATAKSSTKARLPIPALGYFDLDGRVRSYKEWKDAGNPDDWDEEVVWKFDDVWSNITVPRDIAQGFYDGKSYDLQVDHDFARKAQAALQEWLSKKRRR
ncbi:hypothetical protein IJI55_00440, partial [Candidatus Saccharibacteria bacterium]|nr:hypothetical protein [Candidatus Saccharibacteria bacterium]